jgi:hypothetical protein
MHVPYPLSLRNVEDLWAERGIDQPRDRPLLSDAALSKYEDDAEVQLNSRPIHNRFNHKWHLGRGVKRSLRRSQFSIAAGPGQSRQ